MGTQVVECPLCRLQRKASELSKERTVEDLAQCAAAPLELAALQVRVGCRLLAAGAFFVARGLCETKSFAERDAGLTEAGRETHESA